MLLDKIHDFIFGVLPVVSFYVIVFTAVFSLMFFIGGVGKLPSILSSVFLAGFASWLVADTR